MDYLPEVLISQYMGSIHDRDSITSENSPYYILTQTQSLQSIKSKLGHAITRAVDLKMFHYGGLLGFLSIENGFKSLMDRGDFHLMEYTDIMVCVRYKKGFFLFILGIKFQIGRYLLIFNNNNTYNF